LQKKSLLVSVFIQTCVLNMSDLHTPFADELFRQWRWTGQVHIHIHVDMYVHIYIPTYMYLHMYVHINNYWDKGVVADGQLHIVTACTYEYVNEYDYPVVSWFRATYIHGLLSSYLHNTNIMSVTLLQMIFCLFVHSSRLSVVE
jgi:hypothetical protein